MGRLVYPLNIMLQNQGFVYKYQIFLSLLKQVLFRTVIPFYRIKHLRAHLNASTTYYLGNVTFPLCLIIKTVFLVPTLYRSSSGFS